MNKLMVAALSLVLVIGCSTEEKQENAQLSDNSKQEKVQESKVLSTAKQALIESKKENNNVRRSISINKEKFTTTEYELDYGSKVYNMAMREYGTIKSTVVVVGDVSKGELTAEHSIQSIAKIAEDTYRLSPKAGVTVYQLYKSLAMSKALTTVELEIDYSGSKTPTADY